MQVYSMDDDKHIQGLREKIDQLNQQAWQVRVNDSNQAHLLSKQAIDLAERIEYDRGKAEGYRTFAFSLIRLSKHHEAQEYLKKALPLLESLNDIDGQSSVYEYFGIIERSFGNYAGSLELLFKGSELAIQAGNIESESLSYYHLGATYKYLGDYQKALNFLLKSLSKAKLIDSWIAESASLKLIGQIHFETGDYLNAITYNLQSLELMRVSGDKWGEAGCLDSIGFSYFKLKNLDKALDFCLQALSITELIHDKKGQANALFHLANIYLELQDYSKASAYCNNSLFIRRNIEDKKGEAEILLFLADLKLKENTVDQSPQEAFNFFDEALQLAGEIMALDLVANIHMSYYEACKRLNLYQEALTHIEAHIKLSKEINSDTIKQKIQNLEISHQAEKSRKEAEVYRERNIELAELNEKIQKQKDEVELQKKIAENTLAELKATQIQLIQTEKMASLGELTAGIAHEIQNPLNFVNNFSELNKELIDELKSEKAKVKSERDEKLEDELLNDIAQNEEKINHHGKRAGDIVKGMLQHSRSSVGVKEPTDINALCDEYLRLSYHGLRAKDKTFNATIKTDFDASLKKINIIPQDIGRVILNLLNNAFYAALLPPARPESIGEGGFKDPAYKHEPTVTIKTSRNPPSVGRGTEILISVTDNGPGIPQKVLDKIFQPFFTTKPTGQGTGLGLSLSYDIIKAHGGEMKVDTKEGEYAEFVILLPNIKEA
ncbi:MAG: tetratricopeptide repeat protein [Saprospiraceae bacterium]